MGDFPAGDVAAVGLAPESTSRRRTSVLATGGPGYGDGGPGLFALVYPAELEPEDASAVQRIASKEEGRARELEVRGRSGAVAVRAPAARFW